MSFSIVAGDATKNRAAAIPRHWFAAFVIFIVAQWLLQTVSGAAFVLFGLAGSAGIAGMFEPVVSQVLLVLVSELLAYGALASVAIAFSARMDRRGPAALGLGSEAFPGFAVWMTAGFVAALPVFAPLLSLAQGWLETAVRGTAVLFPVILVQAGAEEILFRGVLLASLAARYGALRGLLLSAMLFALWHVYLGQPLPDLILRAGTTFVFGLTSGLLVLRQGHLGGAIALHMFWNLALALSAGLESWPESFWNSLPAYFYSAPMMFWDFEEVNRILLPLIIETAIVLVATKATLARIVSERAPRLATH
jgi:uncharacterized protein